MHEDIDSGNYDCSICFRAVTRATPVWACANCYHAIHLTCANLWRKQGAVHGLSRHVVRCPACNKADGNDSDASSPSYCWCGKAKAFGAAPRALPPHSCGRICGKPRPDCAHTCPSVCHAGPCPPCTETGLLSACFCGKDTTVRPCSAGPRPVWSCGAVCNATLACGVHRCQRPCHPGDCGTCVVVMPSVCYCGKAHRDLPCKDRAAARLSCRVPGLGGEVEKTAPTTFEGVFQCDAVCNRPFDCGLHSCRRPCHPQDADCCHCPTSPDLLTRCRCGKTPLSELAALGNASARRTACTDPVPACDKVCGKALDCGHLCAQSCHDGPCAPCEQMAAAACACGQISRQVVCGERAAAAATLRCDTICRAWMSCKQHRCANVCCPGKPKAAARLAKGKGRPSAASGAAAGAPDIEAEHTCLRPCGRTLRCGRHVCEQVCHKGACYSCVAYVAGDDLHCPCGATVVPAPYLCGTVLPPCDANCRRPLPCGHAAVAHACHDRDTTPCPRCKRLVAKHCLCGKHLFGRVPCGVDAPPCHNVCGRLLGCGLHRCRQGCHAPGHCEDEAEAETNTEPARGRQCSQTCGQPRPLCGHPCQAVCHGAGDCPQDAPCGAAVEVACACGRMTRRVRCNACAADPAPAHRQPDCDDECLRLQRNARLRDALRISDDYKEEHLAYPAAVMNFFLGHRAKAAAVETELRTFASSPSSSSSSSSSSTTVFEPMDRAGRQFVHQLAELFGLHSVSHDIEPHRYVVVSRPAAGDADGAPPTALPSLSLAESEEIYKRLNEMKAEAKAKAAAEAAAEAAEAAEAAAAAQAQADALDPARKTAARRRRRAELAARPCNAILVPAAHANAFDEDSGDASGLLALVEAWHQQHGRQDAPSPTAARVQHTVLPSGDVAVRVVMPAAAPAVVEALLTFMLPFMKEWWEGEEEKERDPHPLSLCYLSPNGRVVRRGGDEDDDADDSDVELFGDGLDGLDGLDNGDDNQWNVVAATATRRPAAASPAEDAAAATSGRRVVLKLRGRAARPRPEAARARWMAILAEQPTEGNKSP